MPFKELQTIYKTEEQNRGIVMGIERTKHRSIDGEKHNNKDEEKEAS